MNHINKMLRNRIFNRIVDHLPYEARRSVFRAIRPDEYASLQERRNIDTDKGYSLKPYDANKCIFVHIPG